MSISVEGYVIVVLRDANADLTRKVDNDSNPQSPLSSSVSSVFTSSAVSPNTAHVSPGTRFPRGGKKEKPKDTAAQESLSRTDLQYVLGKMTGSGCGNTPVTVVEVVDENNFRHCKDRETLSDASLLSDTCREMGAAYALKKYSDVQTSGKHTRSSSSGSSSNNSRDNSCNTNSDVDHSINDSRTGGETYPHAFLLQGLEMLMTTVLLQSVKET
ncbi:hypothetical protein AGDE_12632 [Angomonas deanei]|nr:hypothetical protein AGDE_12632 [Angomonas deanei]|eukprot:EPY23923.1 hypothetical protein AGDE_12632 [Angomonas deanei]